MSADLKGKLETQLEIDAPADKFFNMWKKECHKLPDAIPHHMKAVDVHEGDWEIAGSIKIWNYTIGGRHETYKERVEVDEENMTVALVGIEGDVFKHYKCWKPIIKATPKSRGSGSVLTLTLEYERLNDDIPVPYEYSDFMVNVSRDLASHIVNNESN